MVFASGSSRPSFIGIVVKYYYTSCIVLTNGVKLFVYANRENVLVIVIASTNALDAVANLKLVSIIIIFFFLFLLRF